MKRLLLCLNMFNMWMADRAWILKFLPLQRRVMTKRMGLVHNAGYLASPCFRLPLLKNGQLHSPDSTARMLFGNKLLWNVARRLQPWNVFILSAHILLFLSLLCMNSVTWIKCSVTVGWVLEAVAESYLDIRLYQMSCCSSPTRCHLGDTI